MKLIDLTMPVWPGAGYGEILPFTNTPVDFVEYMDYAKNGLRQTRMKLNGETGSPLMVAAQHAPFDMTPIQKTPRFDGTLDEIPLQELVLHDTAVLDITAGEGHEITADEMAAALKVADFRHGDHVLLRTGWGTLARAYEMGIDYLKKSPSVRYEAAALLAEMMEQRDSKMFLTDCALVNPPRVQGYNWYLGDTPMTPLPKPWPSAEARERLMDMGGSYAYAHTSKEPSSYGALIRKTIACGKCLVNCTQITERRVKMIILPLCIKKGGASSCRFVAVEDSVAQS
jgi:kynurenine formamidase